MIKGEAHYQAAMVVHAAIEQCLETLDLDADGIVALTGLVLVISDRLVALENPSLALGYVDIIAMIVKGHGDPRKASGRA